jgi:two-component system LytT family response regulator
MLKVVIIDDELNAREVIANTLLANCENVSLVGTADNVKTGIRCIEQNKPDIVLLDVQMPDGTGFDLLSQIKEIDFKVIFITAHQEFAMQAFKFSALDYILKPVDTQELVQAIKRASDTLENKNISESMSALHNNIKNPSKEAKKLILKSSDQIHAINVKDVVRCESDGNYTRFVLSDGRKLLATKLLKDFDEMLQPYNFFRVHQSHLINIDYFETYKKSDGGTVIMSDKSEIPLATRKKDAFLKLLSSL